MPQLTELIGYEFFRNALAGVLLISIISGIVGTYIVTRRMVSLAGGITHACFGGLGLGYFLGWNPLWPAMVFGIGASMGVEWMSLKARMRSDSAIAAVWALGMAVGVIMVFLTPGYVPELNAFLFGNILTISRSDLAVTAIFCCALLLFFIIGFKRIVMAAFDPDFARVRGLDIKAVNLAMTVFVAVGIVLTIRLVGVMLLMSMLALPPMISELFSHRYRTVTYLAIGVATVTSLAGLIAATAVDVPCSALIVVAQVTVFALAAAIKKLANR